MVIILPIEIRKRASSPLPKRINEFVFIIHESKFEYKRANPQDHKHEEENEWCAKEFVGFELELIHFDEDCNHTKQSDCNTCEVPTEETNPIHTVTLS